MSNRKWLVSFSLALIVVLSGCGQSTTTASGSSTTMDHGEITDTHAHTPYDAMFIDSMIDHHRGAIEMAQQALKESQRAEIIQLAQTIIATQQQEIDQMTAWRKQWYPNEPVSEGMGMSMGDMQISKDTTQPFDRRFLTAMISHHQGAIEMARDAQTKAEHAEIKELAREIIQAQEAEINQMQTWSRQWFGQ